jgi:hypothetical protein
LNFLFHNPFHSPTLEAAQMFVNPSTAHPRKLALAGGIAAGACMAWGAIGLGRFGLGGMYVAASNVQARGKGIAQRVLGNDERMYPEGVSTQ